MNLAARAVCSKAREAWIANLPISGSRPEHPLCEKSLSNIFAMHFKSWNQTYANYVARAGMHHAQLLQAFHSRCEVNRVVR